MTPADAIDNVERFLIAASPAYGRGDRPDISESMDVLAKHARHGCEAILEWGEPGDCQARLDNDTDIADTIGNGLTDEEFDAEAIRRGLGRHYGQPHCIYCLEAM